MRSRLACTLHKAAVATTEKKQHRLRHGGRGQHDSSVGAGSTASPYLSAFVKLSASDSAASTGITVRLAECARSNAWVSFDGRDRQELLPGDHVAITTSEYMVPSISARSPAAGLVQRFSRMLPLECALVAESPAIFHAANTRLTRLLQLLVPLRKLLSQDGHSANADLVAARKSSFGPSRICGLAMCIAGVPSNLAAFLVLRRQAKMRYNTRFYLWRPDAMPVFEKMDHMIWRHWSWLPRLYINSHALCLCMQ
uniref:Uncharacterized protein n=1 Tax=Macrostomum lignano TaxID=282301 RepID=A0A1I8FHY6_9PLAT